MKRVLIYINPVTELVHAWDVTTKYERDHGYSQLFFLMDDLGLYSNADSAVNALLDMARQGNPEAAEAILAYRRSLPKYGYEEVVLQPSATERTHPSPENS